MISFKQLNYALAVEKTLHFKKAAELCHVSQSALSTALSELESQLGLQIFERDNKKVLLTPIGREVLDRARNIILEVEGLQDLAASQQEPLSFPVSLGVIPTIAPYLLPRLLPVLNKRFPEARINVVEEQSSTLVDLVRRGQIDTAVLALPYSCDGLLTLEFWQEDFYWVSHKGATNNQKKEVAAVDIDADKLLLLKEGHCLKDHVLDVCRLSESRGNQGFGATSLNTLIQMVKGNLGTTLVPAMAKEQLIDGDDELTAVHLNEPSPHRRVAFILRPNYTRISSIEALRDICRSALPKTKYTARLPAR